MRPRGLLPAIWLNQIAGKKRSSSYLEIGCFKNGTFNNVEVANKIGVDPVEGGTHRMGSDEFFKKYQGNPFDLIFIDGLHEQKQFVRDVLNSLSVLHQHGVIVAHDCLPQKKEHQLNVQEFQRKYEADPPNGYAWNGDVWKGFTEVRTWNEVDSCTFDAHCGYGLVIKRPNTSYLRMVPEVLDWEAYKEYKEILLRIVDQEQACKFLGI